MESEKGTYAKLCSILKRGCIFINAQKDRLIRRMSLPDEFLRDLESFEERNSLVEPKAAAHVHRAGVCCSRCLKAYALTKAREMHLDCAKVAPLFVVMNCEAGHHGYFEDGGRLVAVS